jgi:hypothetical protein
MKMKSDDNEKRVLLKMEIEKIKIEKIEIELELGKYQ